MSARSRLVRSFLSLARHVAEVVRRRSPGVALAVAVAATGWSQDEPVRSPAGAPGAPAASLDFQTDLFTGRFTYGVPIEMPPGRGRSRPFVALTYDSSGGNGMCGVGWQLTLASIQRDVSHGVPIEWDALGPLTEYDDDKGFVFSFQGAASRLVRTGGTPTAQEYRPLVDRTYLRFVYHDNPGMPSLQPYWEVLDKDGGHHFFGEQPGSRMENTRFPANLGKSTYRWGISRSRDVHGNETQYSYSKEGNLLYPAMIDYGANPGAGLPHTYRVFFAFQTRTVDNSFSYAAGYRVETNQRLWWIQVTLEPPGGATQPIRRYEITYVDSPSTKRSLLASITPRGALSGSLPPLTFQYQDKPLQFETTEPWGTLLSETSGQTNDADWNSPQGRTSGGHPKTYMDLLDIDSDGLPDRVLRRLNTFDNYFVQFNEGTSFSPVTRFWGPLLHDDIPDNSTAWNSLGFTNSDNDTRMAMVDINGDHRIDRVMNTDSTPDSGWMVQQNSGAGFGGLDFWFTLDPVSASTDWNSITGRRAVSDPGTHVDLLDMNGDGLPDRVQRSLNSPYNKFYVQFNTGAGFAPRKLWPNVRNEIGDTSLIDYNYVGFSDSDSDTLVGLWDLNGDGLPDRVMRTYADQYAGGFFRVQFNNGSGFEDIVDWTDVYSPDPNALAWMCPVASSHEDTHAMLADMNGDGLADRVLRQLSDFTDIRVQFNNGHGFLPPYDWPIDTQGTPDHEWGCPIECHDRVTRVTLVDINGDGLLDRVMRVRNGTCDTFKVQLNEGPFPDLMKQIANGSSGTVAVTYEPSTRYDNRAQVWSGDPWTSNAVSLLSFPIQTVARVESDDGFGNTSTLTYDYKHGWFDPVTREFRGFREGSITDELGMRRRTWFHQGGGFNQSSEGEFADTEEAKKGIPFRTDLEGFVNGSYRLFQRTLNKVDVIRPVPDTGWRFPYIAQTVEIDCEGNTSGQYRATAKRYAYDPVTLNLTKESAFGKVMLSSLTDVNSPAAVTLACSLENPCSYTHITYEALANPDILNRPSKVLLTSDDPPDPSMSGRLRETRYTYKPSTGDMLTRSDWRDVPAGWITELHLYDDYGNETQTTNHVNVVTTTTPDLVYHQFPAATSTQVGLLTFNTQRTFDPRSGEVTSQTDPNGLLMETTFDQFLRKEEARITPPGGVAVWKERFSYNIQSVLGGASRTYVRHRTNDGVDAANGHETYTYFDGLGRLIQTRSEAEAEAPTGPGSYRVTDQSYDARGNPSQHTQPYFSTGTQHMTAPIGTPVSSVEYDAIGRVSRTLPVPGDVGSPTAPETIAYEQPVFSPDYWSTIRTDAEGTVCEVRRNAFGWITYVSRRGLQVDSNSTFSYDRLGNITTIALDATHAITMAYDSLGRKLSGSDPDMGAWTYSYDDASQLLEQVDAKGNRTKYFYDELGRAYRKELYAAGSGTPRVILYKYDQSDDPLYKVGKGQLYKVDDTPEGWEKNSYDSRGRLVKRTRYVTKNVGTYTFLFDYNDADKLTYVAYPRNPGFQLIGGPSLTPQVLNVYDTGGNLSRIDRIIKAGSQETLYTATGFDSLGQLTGITYGNGVQTSFMYHPSTRRLKRTQTTGPGSVTLQDLQYTYDAVANANSITDLANSGLASGEFQNVTYDDLHRLTAYTRNGQTRSFSYSVNGNFDVNQEMGNGHYVFDPVHLHQVARANGKNYYYDLNGNMTARGSQTLTWDEENRLSRVDIASSSVTFGYAHDGSRLWRDNGSQLSVWISTTYEVRAGKRLCHVFAGDRRVCTFELFAANGPMPPSSPSYDPVYYYYHGDHLGSTSVLTDRLGGRVQLHEYLAYGKSSYDHNALAFPLSNRFTGHVLDADTGLYYCNARYYDPELGRFVQADQLLPNMKDPQSFNRYTYALGNPLRYTDPSGNNPLLVAILIGGVLGGVSAEIQGGEFGQGFVSGAVSAGISFAFPGPGGWLPRAAAGAAVADIQGGNPLFGAIGGALNCTAHEPAQNLAASLGNDKEFYSLVGAFASNQIGQKAFNSLAMHCGIDPNLLTTAMGWASELGNEISDSRFHKPGTYLGEKGPGISGIFTREKNTFMGKVMRPVFDLIDIGLAVQGLPTASSNELRKWVSAHGVGEGPVWGHSLGAWDVSNLTARGVVKNPTLMALPFGQIATWSSNVYLNTGDFVTGFGVLGHMLNWRAQFVPTGGGIIDSHSQQEYISGMR